MSDELKKRGQALEADYFRKEEAKALDGLATKASARKCPVCSTAMKTIMYESTEIDRCPQGCGVWLDKGELEKIIVQSKENESSWLEKLLN